MIMDDYGLLWIIKGHCTVIMDYGWLWMIKDYYGLVEGKICRKPWISPPIHRYVSCKK
jgi:hypothetical protein